MSRTSSQPEPSGYIRGGGGIAVDSRLILRILVVLTFLTLIGTTIGLAVNVADSQSQANALRDHGVRLDSSVSQCTAITSGIGMGTTYYDCTVTFTLDNRSYTERLRGSTNAIAPGTSLPVVVDAAHPSNVELANAVPHEHYTYGAPVIVGSGTVVLAVALVTGLAVRRRRRAT